MPLYIAKSGDLDRCYRCLTDSLTHSLTTLKDSATQLLIKYKSGALVTQILMEEVRVDIESSVCMHAIFKAINTYLWRILENTNMSAVKAIAPPPWA